MDSFPSSGMASLIHTAANQPLRISKNNHRKQHGHGHGHGSGSLGARSLADSTNNMFVSQPLMDRGKSSRNRQKAYRPSLNSSDLDAFSMANNGNSVKKNQKLSLNHLLNFSFPERQHHQSSSYPSKRSFQPVFNKERFVNSNFRFVMKPEFDDQDHLANPDLIVKWEQVIQMVTYETSTCPICLGPPVAARVAKCGHLFCMPCIQHYVALSDHSWRKCPICFESIYSAALKPILFLPATSYDSSQLGPSSPSIVEFTLIRRDLDSSVALPIISYRKWKTSIPSVDLVSALTFSKFTTATNEYTKMLLNNDIISLTQTLKEIECSGEASYESSFIEMCLDLLQTEATSLEEEHQGKGKKSNEKQVLPAADDSNSFYFYQAADGQHIYLHPLDIKVLKHEFGSYDNFPSFIKLPVISIRESTVNQDLRKRCKYLSHLPLSCDVSFVEVDMSDIVSAPTLNLFNNELSERMEKLIRLEQDRETEKVRQESRSMISSPSHHDQQGSFGSLNEVPGTSLDYNYSYADFGPPLSASPNLECYPPLSTSASTPPLKTFANMAINAATASSWGRQSRPIGTPSIWVASATTTSSGIVEEEISSAWRLEISDTLLSSATSSPAITPTQSPSTTISGGSGVRGSGKKKKPQKIVLLGNGGSRGSLFNH